MNLKQIAADMKSLGEMLIAQAEEIETVLGAIDVRSLTAILGNLQTSLGGGGSIESRPFVKPKPKHLKSSKPIQTKMLTAEQKAKIRQHYDSLKPEVKTKENRRLLAEAYGITLVHMTRILTNRQGPPTKARVPQEEALTSA